MRRVRQLFQDLGIVQTMDQRKTDPRYEKSDLRESESGLSPSQMESCDLTEETRRLLGAGPAHQAPCPGRKRRAARHVLDLVGQASLHGGAGPGTKRRILSGFLPSVPSVVSQLSHKVFCGKYCGPGDNMFMTASQDCKIRLYNTNNGNFTKTQTIEARDVGWSVLDVAVSTAGDALVYSSWNENLHLVRLGASGDCGHVPLPLAPDDVQFCIFSVAFSADDKELLGGANDGCIYIYDRGSDQRTNQILAHRADVNTVCFVDDNTNVLASGADDGIVKVWDRRSLRETEPRPVGQFCGHSDGLVYITSKGDGRYLASNSKDQSIKLWDLRRFSDTDDILEGLQVVRERAMRGWDYRWQRAPASHIRSQVTGDRSVMTYTGHSVLQTLIRCHFSPMANTGQKFIYTGCAKGRVVIYDMLTGKEETVLNGHGGCVRDVSWHGEQLDLVSSSWDGSVVRWSPGLVGENSQAHDVRAVCQWRRGRRRGSVGLLRYYEDSDEL